MAGQYSILKPPTRTPLPKEERLGGFLNESITAALLFKLPDYLIKSPTNSPEEAKRKMKSVRLIPDALKILNNKAKEEKISETEYLENLILKSA